VPIDYWLFSIESQSELSSQKITGKPNSRTINCISGKMDNENSTIKFFSLEASEFQDIELIQNLRRE
jgi:hypothetical protein